MLKVVVQGLAIGAVVGAGLSVVSHGMSNIEREALSVEVRCVREHSSDLFDAFCGLNQLMTTQDEKKAFADLGKLLNRLLTLEKYIENVPKARHWTTRAIDYKYKLRKVIVFLKMRHPQKEAEVHFKAIREAADNACHNVRLQNEIFHETQ